MGEFTPDQLFELKVVFMRELDAGYRAARAHHEKLLVNPSDPEALKALWGFFHRIAGTAQQVELALLGQLAIVCEELSQLALDGKVSAQQKVVQVLSEGLRGVASAIHSEGLGGDVEPLPRSSNPLALLQPDATGEERVLSKVLIVDDDVFSARLIDNVLRSSGLMSSYCCDSEQALAMIAAELPDLIILDVAMPGIDGFDLCRRVRAHPAMQFTPIIFVTRKGDLEQRVRGLEVGGNDYVAKPFEPQELVARVRSHLLRLSELRSMAIRDGLTRCYNHKYFKARLEQEMARSRRYGDDLSLAMVDVDFFKKVNDSFGHQAGDAVLAHLANLIMASVRTTDVVARYGGEEFGIIFVQAGPAESRIITERIRERVGLHPFALGPGIEGNPLIPVTVSLGVAHHLPDETLEAFVHRADAALLDAKRRGRNQVVFETRSA